MDCVCLRFDWLGESIGRVSLLFVGGVFWLLLRVDESWVIGSGGWMCHGSLVRGGWGSHESSVRGGWGVMHHRFGEGGSVMMMRVIEKREGRVGARARV